MTRILAACSPGEVRVAVVRDGALLDYAVWRPGKPDGVGDLLRGRVLAHLPALAGAFVALPGAEGFLPDSAGGDRPEGTVLCVRITRAAQGGKGPRLTACVPQSAGPPGLLERGPGALERLAALHPDAEVQVDDPGLAAVLRPLLEPRMLVVPDLDDAVAGLADPLATPLVELPGGARASIHPTPALVAIDVDGGSTSAERREKTSAQTAANRAVLPTLARQIRLRNLSGAILLDLAGLTAKRRATLGPAVHAALADDPLRPRFLGFTALGLAEIVRPRVHPPLHELLAGPHAAGLAALRRMVREGAARPHAVPLLRAAPDVATALAADAAALADVARRTGRPLLCRDDPALPSGAWRIEDATHA